MVTGLGRERMDSMAMTSRPLRSLVLGLVGLCGLALVPGCGEAPAPQVGTADFDAAKKEYQEARRKEHGFASFEQEKTTKGPTKKE
jgi:hypothetical protein